MAARPRLLIVDDDTVARRALARAFRRRGFSVTEAASVAEAEKRIGEEGEVRVALIDLFLPDGTGVDLLRQLAPERCILITARPDPSLFARAGIRHHLQKPLVLAEVTQLVSRLMEGSGTEH